MVDRIITERVAGAGKVLFNNPLTKLNSNGIRYRPARMRLPSWADYNVMTEGVDDIASTSITLEVERISERRPLATLLDSPLFPRVRKEYRAANLVEDFLDEAPTNDTEIVDEWMHKAAADAAVLSGWATEYNRNSFVEVDSGDPTNPHSLIGVDDFSFDHEVGRQVASRGNARFNTPEGQVEVNNNSGDLLFGPDSIGAGAVDANSGSYQWNGKVAQFKDIAETPIEEPVRFPKLNNFSMPNVINQAPKEESEQQKVSFNISSDAQQDVRFAFRNPNDYTETLLDNTMTVPEGTSQVNFEVAAQPAVPPVATEIEPLGDGNVQQMESYSVEAQ